MSLTSTWYPRKPEIPKTSKWVENSEVDWKKFAVEKPNMYCGYYWIDEHGMNGEYAKLAWWTGRVFRIGKHPDVAGTRNAIKTSKLVWARL